MASIENFLAKKLPENPKKSDKQEIGIGSFTAYVAVNESELLEATAPDVALEDGSTISDTIFLKPKIISIDGEVADVHQKFSKSDAVYQAVNNVIGQVTPYLPNRINSEIDKIQRLGDTARNAVAGLDDALSKGEQIFNIVRKENQATSNQQQFLTFIREAHAARELITVETATGVHNDMAIESVQLDTDNTSGKIMFSISLKQIRKVKILGFPFAGNPSKGLGGQIDKKVNNGVNQGEEKSPSLFRSLVNGIKKLGS